MNYVISPKMTPPILIASGGQDETDGATGGDAGLMDGVCSKTSITSVSSTSMFLCMIMNLQNFISTVRSFRCYTQFNES